MKKIILCLIIIILAGIGVSALVSANTSINNSNIDKTNLEVKDNLIVNDDKKVEKLFFNTDKTDTNTILVENNSTFEISNSVINKTGDSTDNGDNTDFYGTNSAVLVKNGSTAIIKNVEIETNSTGSNAIFVTNAQADSEPQQANNMNNEAMKEKPVNEKGKPTEMPDGNPPPESMQDMNNGQQPPTEDNQINQDYSIGGATAIVDNVKINTYKDKSRGLDATYGGNITATDVIINTKGGSCAAVATDRGEGTVDVKNSQLNTGVDNGTGRGSPCIYSTGNITVKDSKGKAFKSQIACIEGKNSITMTGCEFNCFAEGNRESNGKFVDLGGIFIYQSMSGDANVGTATLNATSSKLSINESSKYYAEAPMFHVTNTNAIINIKGCELSFGSGILLDVSGQDQWGNTGSNGGKMEFNSVEEKLDGNITVDQISSLNFSLEKSDYTGCINQNETFGQTNMVIDSDSTWTLTGDSHISSLENSGKIDYGDYTLFVNGEAFTSSNPYKK